MFFGTAIRGFDNATFAMFVQRMVSTLFPAIAAGAASRVMSVMEAGSGMLEDIADRFQSEMIDTKRIRVFYFWEQGRTNSGAKWDYVRFLYSITGSPNKSN